MATFLYSLGRAAFRWRKLVTLAWIAIMVAVGLAAAKAPAAPDDGFAMPGIESQKALDLLEERFPDSGADGATARVVFIAPNGDKVTANENRKTIEAFVDEAADGSRTASVSDPFTTKAVSKDGSAAYATVTFTADSGDLTDADKKHLETAIDHAKAGSLTVEVGGDALATQPSAGGSAEAIGIGIAAVVLLITFGSLAAAGLPLLTAIIGVGISMAAIIALGSTFGLSLTTGTLASMLGLACGIDYALFVVSRFREERAKGHTPTEAAGLAVGTAGSAVVFAGLTVVIALAGLSVVGIPMLAKMGLTAAGAVLIAVLICLTLVPALLGFWPNAVLSRAVRKGTRTANRADNSGEHNGGTRWARLVVRRPLAVLLLGVVALGALAIPAADLQLGMPGAESKPTTTTERRAYDALADGFGPGFNGPLTIVVDTKGSTDPEAAVTTVTRKIAATDGIVSVSPANFNQAGDTAVLSATPATSPTDARTMDLVQTIRDERPAVERQTRATYEVTGSTAMNIDVAEKFQSALVPYLIVVVGLAVVLLMLVFRSILVPVKAALGYLLSVLAALGAVVLVFQHGYGAELLGLETTGPIMSMMPIFLVGIVFGLAMDYEVFLVSRVREAYVHGDRPGQAVVSGFRTSARVVVAAALIMIAVFSGFVGSGESMIKTIGFGLAAAVLFDAFIVRMAIVPAVLALLGDRAWHLPAWLDRLLPNVDVEGEALTRKHAAPAAESRHQAPTPVSP
ncbi:MMPL family transporter [Streptomyces lomondensis]|uniref:Membrane protein n=1 Tax=Streptomyces lomondensis TaxID=68229 RepID=A0ABQ2XSE6_9ACTN|nr:MMPL family transporter [Streptomyces lomondensis]MCF0080870.1 MMPL family transporter [Streptomyces lomondensis]GGX30923.1 membrane protein [Streptomyces lomondensis]